MAEQLEEDGDAINIFEEPEGFNYTPPAHTFQSFTLEDGHILNLRLVGSSPLWGHHLWQAAIVIAKYLEEHKDVYLRDKTVLELGAGAGLPSLLACIYGAKLVVVTDYPDNNLIENLKHNIDQCLPIGRHALPPNIVGTGFLWGADPKPLLQNAQGHSHGSFQTLILADLLFNHSCHASLLKSISDTLAQTSDATALVFFTPYRPWLLEKDMAFFDLVRGDGRFVVQEIGKWVMDKVMFEHDRGDEQLRKTVFGFSIRWRLS